MVPDLDADQDQVKPEITALLETVQRLRALNDAQAHLIEALQRESPDGELRPLKQLCRTDREYENALRASKRPAKTPKIVRLDGKVLSKQAWVDRWRAATGRLGGRK